jgi:uncharacterized protein
MSEFAEDKRERIEQLLILFNRIVDGTDINQLATEKMEFINTCVPTDIVLLVDRLVSLKISMDDLKNGINKLLGLLHSTIASHPYHPPAKESYLGCLVENNRLLDEKLQDITPLLQKFEQSPENDEVKNRLLKSFKELERFNNYYQIKENILFPEIEKFIEEHRCISVMGSFHSDIREKMKQTIDELSDKMVDYDKFKRLSAELFFLMYSLKFREERILYTFIQNSISDEVLNSLFEESLEIGFPFFQPKKGDANNNLISLN